MKRIYNWLLVIACIVLHSCAGTKQVAVANTDINNLKFTVEEAPEWTKLLNRQHGWFGADGIFVLPANGVDKADSSVENTILFSDTMLGDIVNDRPAPGFIMVHNSVALLKGYEPKEENIEFKWKATKPRKEGSFFIPQTPNAKPDDYYWLGDGFVNHEMGDKSYIFCMMIKFILQNI